MRTLASAILLALLLAAFATAQRTPQKNRAPAAADTALDGKWKGDTSQGVGVYFEVKEGKLTRYTLQYRIENPCPEADDFHRGVRQVDEFLDAPGRTPAPLQKGAVVIAGFEFHTGDRVRFRGNFGKDGVGTGTLELVELGTRGGFKPKIEPAEAEQGAALCQLGTTTIQKQAPVEEIARKTGLVLALGPAPNDCKAFQPVSEPVAFKRGTKAVAYRIQFEPGGRPAVRVRGPWGTTNWKNTSCTEYAIVWGNPAPYQITSIVQRADGQPLPPGKYFVSVGAVQKTFVVK